MGCFRTGRISWGTRALANLAGTLEFEAVGTSLNLFFNDQEVFCRQDIPHATNNSSNARRAASAMHVGLQAQFALG